MKRNLFPITMALFLTVAGFTGCTKKMVKTDAAMGPPENRTAAADKPSPASPSTGQKAAGAAEAAGATGTTGAAGTAGAGDAASGLVSATSKSSPARASERPRENLIADVYFDFDRYAVRPDFRKKLENDYEILRQNGQMKVTIEGHCDERGSAEYNLALGEKRAEAVKRYLTGLGIAPSRISTVSYGSEKPFCSGHDEACWQKNRMAHFLSDN